MGDLRLRDSEIFLDDDEEFSSKAKKKRGSNQPSGVGASELGSGLEASTPLNVSDKAKAKAKAKEGLNRPLDVGASKPEKRRSNARLFALILAAVIVAGVLLAAFLVPAVAAFFATIGAALVPAVAFVAAAASTIGALALTAVGALPLIAVLGLAIVGLAGLYYGIKALANWWQGREKHVSNVEMQAVHQEVAPVSSKVIDEVVLVINAAREKLGKGVLSSFDAVPGKVDTYADKAGNQYLIRKAANGSILGIRASGLDGGGNFNIALNNTISGMNKVTGVFYITPNDINRVRERLDAKISDTPVLSADSEPKDLKGSDHQAASNDSSNNRGDEAKKEAVPSVNSTGEVPHLNPSSSSSVNVIDAKISDTPALSSAGSKPKDLKDSDHQAASNDSSVDSAGEIPLPSLSGLKSVVNSNAARKAAAELAFKAIKGAPAEEIFLHRRKLAKDGFTHKDGASGVKYKFEVTDNNGTKVTIKDGKDEDSCVLKNDDIDKAAKAILAKAKSKRPSRKVGSTTKVVASGKPENKESSRELGSISRMLDTLHVDMNSLRRVAEGSESNSEAEESPVNSNSAARDAKHSAQSTTLSSENEIAAQLAVNKLKDVLEDFYRHDGTGFLFQFEKTGNDVRVSIKNESTDETVSEIITSKEIEDVSKSVAGASSLPAFAVGAEKSKGDEPEVSLSSSNSVVK